MPKVELSRSPAGPARTVTTSGRIRLLDLCDDIRAPVGFGCRAARCTTCRIEVLAGPELLDPPALEEAELLRSIDAPPAVRLACQAVLHDGPGTLRIHWIGPRNA